ncbi:MAG: hypothetical protein J2O48_04925 [Solirubrobacterales bacterium]|nr:hypothetical protein [Solirubrobacterales bacterium]
MAELHLTIQLSEDHKATLENAAHVRGDEISRLVGELLELEAIRLQSVRARDRVPVKDLPDLITMRNRWAVLAAVDAALGLSPLTADYSQAQTHGWWYHDGGGNWAQVFLFSEGRAVLVGSDHEYSKTFLHGIDVLAGLPGRVPPIMQRTDNDTDFVGFAYMYDGTGTWRYRECGVPDGFDQLELPVTTIDALTAFVDEMVSGANEERVSHHPGQNAEVSSAAVARAAELGPDLDHQTLLDLLILDELDIDAGVEAARRFDEVVPVPDGAARLPYPIGLV